MADESFLHNCLFFTANRLSRAITKLAEEEFAMTGLTPMYGYAIRLVNGTPGIAHKELAEKLYITPSTLTRFIDKLESKQLVERSVQGKNVYLYPTEKGKALEDTLRQASKSLATRYKEILEQEMAERLTWEIDMIAEQLEKR